MHGCGGLSVLLYGMRPAAPFVAILSAVIIFVVTFIPAPNDVRRRRQASANLEIENLMAALEQYRRDCGRYPTAEEGLRALVDRPEARGWQGPYVKAASLWDTWKRPFVYRPGEPPEVVSYGVDGKPGGQSFDADITSRRLWRLAAPTPSEVMFRVVLTGVWLAGWVGLTWAGLYPYWGKLRRWKTRVC